MSEAGWRPCATCKKPIKWGAKYWVCSVSTCNRVRMSLAFCSVTCWDAHVPVMNHRSAWCEEKWAPSSAPAATSGSTQTPSSARRETRQTEVRTQRRIIPSTPTSAGAHKEVLIIASRLKAYIKQRADMSTSGDVMEILSTIVRGHTDGAIRRARAEGRRTVMARDYRPLD